MKTHNIFYNIFQPWKIVAIVIALILLVGGIISIMTSENTENKQEDKEKFKIIGVVPDIKWVKFSNDNGELYILSPFGGICEIEIGSDGSRRLFASHGDFEQLISRSNDGWISDNRICTQSKFVGYLYGSPPVFMNECSQYLEDLPQEVQKEVFQTIKKLLLL